MTARLLTVLVGLVLGAVALVYDVVVYRNEAPGDTFSELALYIGTRIAILPWVLAGLVVGHFYWRSVAWLPYVDARVGVPLLVWATVTMQIVALATKPPALVVALVAIPVWGVLWSVSRSAAGMS